MKRQLHELLGGSQKFIFKHSFATTLPQSSKLKCRSFSVLSSHSRQPNTALLLLSDQSLENSFPHIFSRRDGHSLPQHNLQAEELLRKAREDTKPEALFPRVCPAQGLVSRTQAGVPGCRRAQEGFSSGTAVSFQV